MTWQVAGTDVLLLRTLQVRWKEPDREQPLTWQVAGTDVLLLRALQVRRKVLDDELMGQKGWRDELVELT